MNNFDKFLKDYNNYILWKGGNIPPWRLLNKEDAEGFEHYIKSHSSIFSLIKPFAVSEISEDVMIFHLQDNNFEVVMVHFNTNEGIAIEDKFKTFTEWLVWAAENAVTLIDD